jgi:uncharacterized protein (TIGR00645 family)
VIWREGTLVHWNKWDDRGFGLIIAPDDVGYWWILWESGLMFRYDRHRNDFVMIAQRLGSAIFLVRWMLYPVNVGLILALTVYILQFLHDDAIFMIDAAQGWWAGDQSDQALEKLMVVMLGFVDASMVANLIIMIVQGGHEIFIHRFEVESDDRPQYLAHLDTGILKVKVALSISSITLVQILKDFVNLENIEWATAVHRMEIHCMALISALFMAVIWRVTHPNVSTMITATPHKETH